MSVSVFLYHLFINLLKVLCCSDSQEARTSSKIHWAISETCQYGISWLYIYTSHKSAVTFTQRSAANSVFHIMAHTFDFLKVLKIVIISHDFVYPLHLENAGWFTQWLQSYKGFGLESFNLDHCDYVHPYIVINSNMLYRRTQQGIKKETNLTLSWIKMLLKGSFPIRQCYKITYTGKYSSLNVKNRKQLFLALISFLFCNQGIDCCCMTKPVSPDCLFLLAPSQKILWFPLHLIQTLNIGNRWWRRHTTVFQRSFCHLGSTVLHVKLQWVHQQGKTVKCVKKRKTSDCYHPK